MKTIAIQEVEYIAFNLAREKFSFDEPIPDYSTRFPNVPARETISGTLPLRTKNGT